MAISFHSPITIYHRGPTGQPTVTLGVLLLVLIEAIIHTEVCNTTFNTIWHFILLRIYHEKKRTDSYGSLKESPKHKIVHSKYLD